jgi:AcrR family transcriptional regulator
MVDRRTERTRAALLTAFVELVLSQGYEAVGVEDIARTAKVGRSTFYSHYPGKRALLKDGLQRISSGLAACVKREAIPEALTPLLEHYRSQRRINRALFEYPLRALWVKSLAGLIEKNLARAPRRTRLPRALLALTLAEMQIGMIVHWLAAPTPVKSEIVAAALVLGTRAMLDYTPRGKEAT